MTNDVHSYAAKWMSQIGISADFLDDLRKSDDWTFLVKSSALIEASVAHVLLRELHRPEVERFVQRLQLQQKLKLAADLGVLPDHLDFLRYLADLRNSVVHDIRATGFSLSGHLADPQRLRRFVAVLPGPPGYEDIPDDKWPSLARLVMWLELISVLAFAYAHVELVDTRRRIAEFYMEKGKSAGRGLGDNELWSRIGG